MVLFAVLLNLGRTKAAFLGMALSTLLDRRDQLQMSPKTEQKEDAAHLSRWCSGLLSFIKPFAEEAKHKHHSELGQDEELRMEILKL